MAVTIYYENDVQYILIGNKQQLQAIGKTDKNGDPIKVTEPVWAQKQEGHSIGGVALDWRDVGDPTIYYRGDADITSDGDYTKLFAYDKDIGGVGEYEGNVIGKDTRNVYYGSKLSETEVACDKNADKYHVNIERANGDKSEPVYSTVANYIIFRDISLEGETWTPLMFSGTMEGRLNMDGDGTKNVVISNIKVEQSGEMDPSRNIGVGFFGTISGQISSKSSKAIVKNISLKDVTVSNSSNTMKPADPTLVGILVGTVGGVLGLVGGLLDWIIGSIPGVNDTVLGDLKLGDVLGELLNYRGKSEDSYATGAFAGRVIGNVQISNCNVINPSVSSETSFTGGFAGNVEGETEYDGLTKALETAGSGLVAVLNLLPGLGLGDLLPILLANPHHGERNDWVNFYFF